MRIEPPLPDRTKILKYANLIRDQVARDTYFGVLQTVDEARGISDELWIAIWSTLTTEQRQYIHKVEDERRRSAAI